MNELISVIVVTYNSAKTIFDTLESIKNQTYTNLELIVTDDCSQDNTVDIVNSWIEKNYNRFFGCRIITVKKNTGVSENIIRGIHAVHGKYYKDIAGDDLLRPKAIERFRKLIDEDKKIIYQSKISYFYDTNNDKKFADKASKFIKLNTAFLKLDQKEQYKKLLKGNMIHAPGVGLISIQDYNSVGGIETNYSMIEDYPLWIKLSEAGFVFRLVDETLVDYRILSTSISHQKSVDYLMNQVDIFFEQCLKRLLSEKLYKETFIRIIKYSLLRIYLFFIKK